MDVDDGGRGNIVDSTSERNNWSRFAIKQLENLYIYIYFPQLRHHKGNKDSSYPIIGGRSSPLPFRTVPLNTLKLRLSRSDRTGDGNFPLREEDLNVSTQFR